MEVKHNKKRNVGLLSEFFSRYIGEAFIDGRHSDIVKAQKIWNKHINSKSEIFKELQMFNALNESNLQTKEVALNLLNEVKAQCRVQKQSRLDSEKEALIKEINENLNDKKFFDKNVTEYKTYASIQVLMNAWRGIGFKGNLTELAQLEESILGHITKSKPKMSIDASGLTNSDVDGLVVKLMTEKFNNKYFDTFNETQKQILKRYMLSERNEVQSQTLTSLLEKLKTDVISLIKKPVIVAEFEAPLRKKLNEIKNLLETQYSNVSAYNDDMITFYMSVAKLKEELEDKQ